MTTGKGMEGTRHASQMVKLMCSLLLVMIFSCSLTANAALNEDERMEFYKLRNYTWPREYYVPPTDGWKGLLDRRFAQIAEIEDGGERYEAYIQAVSSGITSPRFTESGWGLTRAPQTLVDDLRTAIREGLPNARPEHHIPVVEGERPLFIHRGDLIRRVLRELRTMHEEWSGIKLLPSNAYGFRLYQNASSLNMHVDKPDTHIISSIIHIDHSEDSEPWPIVIEDFQGNTNEVILESGDMLFYESSKCLHGRPKVFNGSWYTSVFTHYRPDTDEWRNTDQLLESHYAVPPIWSDRDSSYLSNYEQRTGEKIKSPLVMVGTSMKEPACEHNWCALENSVKYSGPTVYGEVLSTTGTIRLGGETERDDRSEL